MFNLIVILSAFSAVAINCQHIHLYDQRQPYQPQFYRPVFIDDQCSPCHYHPTLLAARERQYCCATGHDTCCYARVNQPVYHEDRHLFSSVPFIASPYHRLPPKPILIIGGSMLRPSHHHHSDRRESINGLPVVPVTTTTIKPEIDDKNKYDVEAITTDKSDEIDAITTTIKPVDEIEDTSEIVVASTSSTTTTSKPIEITTTATTSTTVADDEIETTSETDSLITIKTTSDVKTTTNEPEIESTTTTKSI